MAQAVQVDFLVSGQVDSSGNRLDSGTVTFYETDGTTLKTIWEDGAKEATASNPHTLSSAGTAQVFADGIYVVVVKTSSGTTVRTITNAYFDPNDTTADVGYIDASEYGSGDDANAIGLAITAASGSDQTIILKPKNWDIDDDLTIPTNINLKYQQGAYTTVASTKTLTVSGTIEAPLYNIFRGEGTVTLDDRNIDIPSIWLISGSHDASAHYGFRTYHNGIKVASEDSTLPGHFQANDDGVNKEVFRLDRVSASPADNDTNDINFYSENDNNEQTSFGKLQYKLLDVSNGTEKGELSLWVADGTDGSVDQVLQLDIDTFTLKTASIDITTQATDIDIIDNNASALSFDASGKTGILELVSSNSSEGVKMSGYLNIGSSTSISSIKDEDNMASNSATALSTQQSIKAYVDSQISTVNTWQEVMDGANTFYTASNDGNPQMRIGATDSEELHIQTVYDSGAQTLDYVIFQTDAASGTADKGEFRFNVDGTLVATLDDGGLEVKASGSISFGAVDILTDSSGTTTLNNIDVLDATTEATIESAIDTLGNLTAASALATVGALNSGSITSGFGTIDIGTSNLTAGAISAGARIITDDSTAATSTTDGSLQTDGGLSVVLDAVIGDDLILLSDAAVIHFGASKDVTMTHVADVGLTITHTGTGDNLPVVLQLKSEEDAVIADEVIASLEFAAGDSDGTDGATVAAGIHAIAEETFAADANATKLVFTAADSETAAASATAKMTLASTGNLTTAGSITAVGSFIIGSADMSETDLEKLDGITNGTATAHKAVVLDVYKNISGIGTVGCGAITSTGNSTFDSTTLVVDSSNNRVGIGIGSPTVSLDVTKSGSSNYINVSDGTVFNYFGVSNSGAIGTIGTVTNHPIRFDTNNAERMRITNAGLVLINDSANANSTIGLTINQDANDNEILSFKSSDVNHGVTDVSETDTWGFFKKNSGSSGGLFGSFLSDATEPVLIQAIETTTTSTAKTTSVSGSISLRAGKANYTAVGNLDSNANIFTLRAFKGGSFATVFIVDEDGDLFADGGTASTDMVTLYDEFSDAELIRTLEIARSENGAKGFVRSAHDDFIKYNEETLVHTGILGAKIKDGGMLNVTGLQRLHSGAIWQIHRENQRLKQSLKSIESHTKKIEKKLELLDLKV